MNFIYEPWFICLLISILLTVIYYAIKLQMNKKKEDEEENSNNNIVNTFIFFIISFILLLILYYLYKYFSDEKYEMKGGADQTFEQKKALKTKIADRLTVVDDDIDVGILED